MSFLDIVYTILIGPLQLVFEIIYTIANRLIGHPGLAIIVLSLIMNFLVLPLYKRSDAMQEEARDNEQRLSKGVNHIKKVFSGDERMMILQTYYRQNHYRPTDALNGSVSLLLEVPFFMAAYNFLSDLGAIQGASLGPITDLGASDELIVIGGISINLLPILMTLVNIISSAIYVKGFPLKTKIQLYGMALFFLVFLYTSPSGLVFYWTLNNVFSLIKTLFYKLKNPRKVLNIMFSGIGLFVIYFAMFLYDTTSIKRKLLILAIGFACLMPMILSLVKDKENVNKQEKEIKNDKKLFISGALFLTVLVGLLIPSTLIAASPQEFVDIAYFYNPVWYVVNALSLATGTFLVWFGVFYWISSPSGKAFFDKLVWVLCGVMLTNYMFFGTDLGIISSNLQFENGLDFSAKQELFNLLIILAIVFVMYVVLMRWKKAIGGVLLTATIALAGMSVLNISTIHTSVAEIELDEELMKENPQFNLSKEGKNVVVLMLDRGMASYIPYIMNEKPELQEQFSGFTYYSNVISFGGTTNFGAPSVFGGYEYTPVELNKRENELLVDKHNEALLVLPVLFSENDYEVTVCDPPYANYSWIPDLSIYDEYPEINAYVTEGKFGDMVSKEYRTEANRRNFFCYSVMKTMPLALQGTIYNEGKYNQSSVNSTEGEVYGTQTITSNSTATGISSKFMEPYSVLENLPNMTKITSDKGNTFLVMANNTTHEPMLLQEPSYEPMQNVDNTEYDKVHIDRFIVNGMTMKMENDQQVIHYHTNMAALLQLGKWFDYMRENDVYDNTRIIIVADHGRPLFQFDELVIDGHSGNYSNVEMYYPMLLVKDFNSDGFSTSNEFMTNADVPTIALEGLIENPVNPFTGKTIDSSEKTAHEQYIIISQNWNVNNNNGNQFTSGRWWAVQDDIWDDANWRMIDVETTRPDLVN